MKLEMNFAFDSEVSGDEKVMKNVCAVLAGADARTVTAEPTKEKQAVVVLDKVVEKLKEDIKEAVQQPEVKEEVAPPATTQTPATKPAEFDPRTATEAEMMDMETEELMGELEDLGIDPNKKPGKNTNKKLRDLILAWQASPEEPTATQKEEVPAEPVAAAPIAPMTYEEAKDIIAPFFADIKKRAAVQKLMIDNGAKKVTDGVVTCSLGVLKTLGQDYRPLVEAVKAFKYDK